MLKIQNINHQYRHALVPALIDINMTVEKGMCLGLLGPNGAGKTTLLSLLAGLQSVQSGQILLNDVSLNKLAKKQSQVISLIPQDLAFYPLLSVWENMLFFASLYRIRDKSFLTSLLADVDLIGYRSVLAKNLSGGLKRRLNFAIGLINSPSLIFMDEITVGVDPVSRQFILDAIKALTEKGTTIVYTSHYLYEIEEICKQITILEQGKIRYQGSVDSILHDNIDASLSVRTKIQPPENELITLNGQYESGTIIFSQLRHPLSHILASLEKYTITSVHHGHGSLESFYLSFLKNSASSINSQSHSK